MNIERKNIDEVNILLTMEVEKADYQPAVEKALKDYRKKANMPGFRPGCVPMSYIKKLYGKALEAEEINKFVGENLYKYIQDNKLAVLGEPLPSEVEKSVADLDSDKPAKFFFDIAVAPEFKVELNGRNSFTQYQITVDDKMLNDAIKQYTSRFGHYDKGEKAEENDLVKGVVVELENGAEKEGGVKNEGAILSPKYISEEGKKLFLGAAVGAQITFNPKKVLEQDAEVAAFLKINKEDVAVADKDYLFTINEISRYVEAELNQDLFDKAFGKDVVKSEAEFKSKLEADIKDTLEADSEFKLLSDVRAAVLKKMEDLKFPEAFLKRWLKATAKDKKEATDEEIEKQFPEMLEGLKWQLAKDQLAKANDVKVEEKDLVEFGKKVARAQFAQYGMMSVPEDVAENYAHDMLKDKNAVRNMVDRVIEEKILAAVKGAVKLSTKQISVEEFQKLVSEEAK
ncbi:MAG: trigger factor [Bacteroidales bacterium]|nr:trigger factor [Candidatus Physcocola equi]